MGKIKYSDKQKDEWVDAVDKLRNGPEKLTLHAACKRAGVEPSLYAWWRGTREGKYNYRKKPAQSNQDLGKSITLAINQLEGPKQRAAPIPRGGGEPSFLGLLNRVYAIKAALSELERDLLEGATGSGISEEL